MYVVLHVNTFYAQLVTALSEYKSKPGDYALSIDLDVDLWMAYRKFHAKQELSKVSDFVVINTELHGEFDAFKKSEIRPEYSYIQVNDLFSLYCLPAHSGLHKCTKISKYGNTYVELHAQQIDGVIEWVYEMRAKYIKEGDKIFYSDVQDLASPGK